MDIMENWMNVSGMLRRGNLSSALSILERNRSDASVIRVFANYYFQNRMVDEAMNLINGFRGQDRKSKDYYHPEVCGVYAKYLLKNNRENSARALLKEVIDAGRADGGVYTMYAGLIAPEVAIAVLEQARVQPELKHAPNLCRKLAQLYHGIEQDEVGAILLKEFIEAGTADGRTYTIYAEMANRDEAILELEKAASDKFYYDAAVCNKLADLYFDRNKGWDRYQAIILLEELIESGNADCHAYTTYSRVVDAGTALKVFDKAKIRPDNKMYEMHQFLKDTVKGYEARLCDPTYSRTATDIYHDAAILAHRKEFQEAIDLTKGSTNTQVMALRGFLYSKMGNHEQAVRQLEAVINASIRVDGEPEWFALSTLANLARMGFGKDTYKECMAISAGSGDVPFLKIENFPESRDEDALKEYQDAPIKLPSYKMKQRNVGIADGGVEDKGAVRSR